MASESASDDDSGYSSDFPVVDASCILGAGAALSIVSSNVTLLTRERLAAVLHLARQRGAQVIALQETRHLDGGFPWATDMAAEDGFSVHWSPAPGANAAGARGNGGTAVLWLSSYGPATRLPSDSHRHVGVALPQATVWSCYGPQRETDLVWVADRIEHAERCSQNPAVVVGDLNWKKAYAGLFSEAWTMADSGPTVVAGDTRPARCLSLGCGSTAASADAVLGIPHHRVMNYITDIAASAERRPRMRLRRTAAFQWSVQPLPSEIAKIVAAVDDAALHSATQSKLLEAWKQWHARAEAACTCAALLNVAVQTGKAERGKGSMPTSRRAPDSARHRPPESVQHRRLKRFHRQAVQFGKFCGQDGPLTDKATRSWDAYRRDHGFSVRGRIPNTWADAQEVATTEVNKLSLQEAEMCSMRWRRRFRTWTADAIRAGGRLLRGPAHAATFTETDMRAQWTSKWCPGPDEVAAQAGLAWNVAALAAEVPPCEQGTWKPPSRQRFLKNILRSSGAAGMDGWASEEAQALANFCPALVDELYDLLVRTLTDTEHGMSPELQALVSHWRVVGIPKRDPTESRPIAVASVFLRAWHRCLADSLPPLSPRQWSEAGVARAFIDWMSYRGVAGAEIDLAAAFDMIQHDVAQSALTHGGTPKAVVAWLRHTWSGPRYCHVRGALAEPLWPTRGIPAGDPLSMRILGIVLEPWHKLVEMQHPALRTWAYADDRSIVACAQPAGKSATLLVDEALDVTEQLFDKPIGVQENRKKRQRWSCAETCEHLGLVAAPAARGGRFAITTRDSWQGIRVVARRLPLVPGPMATREALATICILPKIRWAAPMIAVPPTDLDKAVMRGIVRSASTQWCFARFWADNIVGCPTYATALQALKSASLLVDIAVPALRRALDKHAELLSLEVVHLTASRVWVTPRTECDDQVRELALGASHSGDVPFDLRNRHAEVFDASSESGRHTCRAIARVCCLMRQVRVSRPRFDVRGLEGADVEVLAATAWKKWKSALSPQEVGALRLWRSGAILSPTRFVNRRDPTCPFCAAEWASARHLWADCPHFDDRRQQLQTEVGFDAGWWSRQPSCTSKSGWVTFDAARTRGRRVAASIAANKLGIDVVIALGGMLGEPLAAEASGGRHAA